MPRGKISFGWGSLESRQSNPLGLPDTVFRRCFAVFCPTQRQRVSSDGPSVSRTVLHRLLDSWGSSHDHEGAGDPANAQQLRRVCAKGCDVCEG